MRFIKFFTLFLAIQILSFGIWNTFFYSPEAAPVTEVYAAAPAHTAAQPVSVSSVPEAAVSSEAEATVKPAATLPEFSVKNFSGTQTALNTVQKEQISRVLRKLPAAHAESVRSITLDYNRRAYRGLGGSNLIILRAVGMDTEEMISVLVHETGHNVDYGFLSPVKQEQKSAFKDGSYPLYITDPSLTFYKISWDDEDTLKKTVTNMDFVSGYATTDCFEDFAETYTYYVLHNKDFKALAAGSEKLYEKYVFMRDFVFNGAEFDTGDGEVNMNKRTWDITLLPYEMEDFLE